MGGELGLAGHVRLVAAGIRHDDHGVAGLVLVDVTRVELDGLGTLERQDVLVKQLPPGLRIGVRGGFGGGGGEHLGAFEERGLACLDVLAGVAVLLVLGQSVVVVADLEHGGVDAGVPGILPLHRGRGERAEITGDHVVHLVVGAALDAGHGLGTGVVGVLAGGEEYHVSVERIVPERLGGPGHAGVVGVDLDASVAVLGVGAGPVDHVGGLPRLDLERAILLVLAPSLSGDLEVGGDHVVLVAVMGLEHIWIAQALGVGVGHDDRVRVVDLTEGEEVVAVGGGFVERLADLAIGGGRIGQEGHGSIGAVRHAAGPLLDRDLLGAGGGGLPGGHGGGHRGLDVAVAVGRAGDHAGATVRIGGAHRRRLIVGVGAGDQRCVAGRPGDRGPMFAFGGHGQVLRGHGLERGERAVQIGLHLALVVQSAHCYGYAAGRAAHGGGGDGGLAFRLGFDQAVIVDGGHLGGGRRPGHIAVRRVGGRNFGGQLGGVGLAEQQGVVHHALAGDRHAGGELHRIGTLVDLDVIHRAVPVLVIVTIERLADVGGGAAEFGHVDAGVRVVADKFAVAPHGHDALVNDELVVMPQVVVVLQSGVSDTLLVAPGVIGDDHAVVVGAQVEEQVVGFVLAHGEREVVPIVVMTGFGGELHRERVAQLGEQLIGQLGVLAVAAQTQRLVVVAVPVLLNLGTALQGHIVVACQVLG